MDKDPDRKAATGRAGVRRWNEKRTLYKCADGVDVLVPGKKCIRLES